MAFGVGGVHEANPQEEAMAPSPSGMHEVDPTLDVSSLSTPTIVLMNYDYDLLEFFPSCQEVGSKGVK
jgi:hypothetical protein